MAARSGKRLAMVPTTWGTHGYDLFLDDGTLNPVMYTHFSPISPLWNETHLGWIGEYPKSCTCRNKQEKPGPKPTEPEPQPHGGTK